MATKEQQINANRLSSLTYMIAACLGYSIDELFNYLDKSDLKLVRRDKMIFNQAREQIKRLKGNLTTLEELAFEIIRKDQDAIAAYEDATQIYWVAFKTLLDRGGTDDLCDLRLKALVDIIGKYKSLLHLPGLGNDYQRAFLGVSRQIKEDYFTKEDFKNLLEVYEDKSEEIEGKV